MYVLYDYRYVIACSNLPSEFRREFRRLARGRVKSTFDRRTGTKTPVPDETQCRRVAELLAGFEALRASGYAPQTPLNFQGKHLRFLVARWSAQRLTSEDAAEKLEHWHQFLLWIRRRALLTLLILPVPAREAGVDEKDERIRGSAACMRPDIPVLTRDKAMEALTEHRGNLRKAARALGTTTHAVFQALNEGRPPRKELPPGLTIKN
ncbi:hypothetical protein [Paraburkholderia sp. BR10954]|uniref:hypothetical protein n=1 Tax=Paraburkholderia sp. BR10954 TaxID=3236995 RepID=UPI0034D1653A